MNLAQGLAQVLCYTWCLWVPGSVIPAADVHDAGDDYFAPDASLSSI